MITGYTLSTANEDMDLSVIHGYFSASYWAEKIPLETMSKAIENSLCFGIFTESGQQVAFARTVTDSATFAYLADVFVLKEHRGLGISKWLMNIIIEEPRLQGLRRMLLATNDAHGLYEQFGFKLLGSPELFMEVHQKNVYQ